MKKKLLIPVALIFGHTTFCQIPTNGLVGWFPFSNAITDETGNSTNLVFNGTATYVNDRDGNANSALLFEEINNKGSYIVSWVSGENTAFPTGSDPRTISGWYYSTAMPNLSHTAIVSWGSGSTDPGTIGQASALFASMNGDQLFFWSAWNDAGQATTFGNGQWYHFAVTFDGASTLNFYKDGVAIGTQILTSTVNTVSNNGVFFIGRSTHQNDMGAFDGYFNGALDDVGVWNRELSALEIEQVFEASAASASLNDDPENAIRIFPNPANDQINISSSVPTSFSITDVNGRILSTGEVLTTETIDITSFDSGVYMIFTAEGKSLRFIKK